MFGRIIYDTTYLKTINIDVSGGQSGTGWYIQCSDYGWAYCDVGQQKGDSSAFYFSMNVAHQITPADIALLIQFASQP